MREKLFLSLCTALLLGMVLIEPETALKMSGAVLGSKSNASEDENLLMQENAHLRAQISALQNIQNQEATSRNDYITAAVFSRYPFNYKNEVTVGAGKNEGVEEGKAVIVNGFLLGYVTQVHDSMSVVKTIFDTKWTSAVRIKKDGIDALLSGGLSPSLTLIPKEGNVVPGDSVYSADFRFPYGIAIGEVKSVEKKEEGTFQSATISPGFDLSALRTVLILK